MPFPRLTPLFLLALISTSVAQAQKNPATRNGKPLLYLDVSDDFAAALNHEAEKAYAGKFQMMRTTPKEGFTSAGVKGGYQVFSDPRSMRDYEKRGQVQYAFIVTSDGRVIEPRILQSTDVAVSNYIINYISYRRYFPARLRGTLISSLNTGEWKFGGPDTSSRASGDGLGIYHSRDR